MAFGKGAEPSFVREQKTLEEVRKNVGTSAGALAFVSFLEKLDPTKTAIFYEKETQSHSGREGYRVVHFEEKVEEKWHNAWGQTWYGLRAWMS